MDVVHDGVMSDDFTAGITAAPGIYYCHSDTHQLLAWTLYMVFQQCSMTNQVWKWPSKCTLAGTYDHSILNTYFWHCMMWHVT